MARMKKGEKHIKTLNHKDREVFRCVNKTGWISREDAKEHFKISDRRFDNYVKDNYFQEVETKWGTFCKFTDEGKSVAEKTWGFENHYSTQSVKHDYEITNKYLSLDQEQRENSYTERELRHQLTDRANELINSEHEHERDQGEEILKGLQDGTISCPDFAYVQVAEQGYERIVTFEVVTKNYTEQDIQAKENYCAVMNYSYEQVRV